MKISYSSLPTNLFIKRVQKQCSQKSLTAACGVFKHDPMV